MYTSSYCMTSNKWLLFVCCFSSHSRTFHSFEDVIITGEGLQMLTYVRHAWALSSDGSLTCHNYCGTDISLEWSSPGTRDTRTFCQAVELSLPVLKTMLYPDKGSNPGLLFKISK